MMMLAIADQRDTPKFLNSGGRMSVTRQVTGPIQPSETRMEMAKQARNRPYLHGKRLQKVRKQKHRRPQSHSKHECTLGVMYRQVMLVMQASSWCRGTTDCMQQV